MNNKLIFLILIIGLVAFFAHRILSKFKVPKIGALTMVTGGVKTGKSTFAIYLAIKHYKRAHRSWKLRVIFCRLFHLEEPEEPLLYSNIPLTVPYVKISEDLLLRKKRFRFGSVIYIGEASLVADSQLIQNMDINQQLLLFNKLIGHSTHGGYLIYDSQSMADLHYSCKRALSGSLYVHHMVKWIPFLMVAYIREERYDEAGGVVNTYDKDVEESLKKVIIPKRVWKKFDSYCYSTFTDDLPIEDEVINLEPKSSLKALDIVSFRHYNVKKESKNEK